MRRAGEYGTGSLLCGEFPDARPLGAVPVSFRLNRQLGLDGGAVVFVEGQFLARLDRAELGRVGEDGASALDVVAPFKQVAGNVLLPPLRELVPVREQGVIELRPRMADLRGR